MSKILIVDDSATMRKIIKRVLRQADLPFDEVLEAANGLEGLEQLAAQPDISLILSDVNMPEMDGLTMVAKVRETHGEDKVKIMMITTEGGEEIRGQAASAGANGYITKPFTPDSIKAALERHAA
ncbi:MAG: two-component system chemotaxis response regulator CheY [Chlamydiales bacterium]|jgi:two-component system chemotaxis response regulator CheY